MLKRVCTPPTTSRHALRCQSLSSHTWSWGGHPSEAIALACIPPVSWYHSEAAHQLDAEKIFGTGWQLAEVEPLQAESFRSGRLGKLEYLLVKAPGQPLRAYHNASRPRYPLRAQCYRCGHMRPQPPTLGGMLTALRSLQVCRHHAAVVVDGSGCADAACRFTCPYHGTVSEPLWFMTNNPW